MKKMLFLVVLTGVGFLAKAQTNPFPSIDSLEKYINRYIRNSPVEAFQNLRMNTTLIGLSRFLRSSSIGSGVDTMYALNDSTLRLVTNEPQTFDVVIKGGAGGGSATVTLPNTRVAFGNTSNVITSSPNFYYDSTNKTLVLNKGSSDSSSIMIQQNFIGSKRWLTIRPPVTNDSTLAFLGVSEIAANDDLTRSNHVVKLGSIGTDNPAFPRIWDTWETNWFTGGANFLERHYSIKLPNGDESRLFSSTFIARDSMESSDNTWDFRATTFNWKNLTSLDLMSLAPNALNLFGNNPVFRIEENSDPNAHTDFQQVGEDMTITPRRNINFSPPTLGGIRNFFINSYEVQQVADADMSVQRTSTSNMYAGFAIKNSGGTMVGGIRANTNAGIQEVTAGSLLTGYKYTIRSEDNPIATFGLNGGFLALGNITDAIQRLHVGGKVQIDSLDDGDTNDSVVVVSGGLLKKIAQIDIVGPEIVTYTESPIYVKSGAADTIALRYGFGLTGTAADTTLIVDTTLIATQYDLTLISGGGGVADPGGNGVMVRTALNTTINRTLTGTTDRINITDGDGVAGNPTFNIGSEVLTTNDAQSITATKTFSADQNFNNRIVLTGVSNAIRINDRSGDWITELVRDAGKFKLTAQRPDASFHDIWSLSMIAPDNHFVIGDNGQFGLGGGITSPAGYVHIKASTSTIPHMLLAAGTAVSSPTEGMFWYDGTNLSFRTASSTVNLLSGGTSYTFSTGLNESAGTVTNNLSTGVSGGQTAIGGTASANNLTLSSTSHATKGKILFGTSAYDEANNRLGIGTASPSFAFDLTGQGRLLLDGNQLIQRVTNSNNSYGIEFRRADGTAMANIGHNTSTGSFSMIAASGQFWEAGGGGTAILRLNTGSEMLVGNVGTDEGAFRMQVDGVSLMQSRTALTNTISRSAQFSHTTSGTAAAGLGAGFDFKAENGSGTNVITGAIENPYTTVTNAAENADMVFKNVRAGTLTEGFRVLASGAARFNNAFTFPTADGSSGQVLQTDGSGAVTWQTVTGGGISGSGTSGRMTFWNGASSITSDANLLYSASDAGTLSLGTTNTQGHFNIGGNKNMSASGAQSYFAPATYTDIVTSASGTSSSWVINVIGAPTIAATNSSVSVPSATTLSVDAPVAGTNVTFSTPPFSLQSSGATSLGQGVKRAFSGIASGTTNINYTHDIVQCNATSGNVTATLPNSTIYGGFTFTFIRSDASGNTVTINTTSSQTINGNTTYSLAAQYNRVTVVSDGSNWLIIESN